MNHRNAINKDIVHKILKNLLDVHKIVLLKCNLFDSWQYSLGQSILGMQYQLYRISNKKERGRMLNAWQQVYFQQSETEPSEGLYPENKMVEKIKYVNYVMNVYKKENIDFYEYHKKKWNRMCYHLLFRKWAIDREVPSDIK